MLLMYEKGIRGGITQTVKRYAKADIKHMKERYNPDEKSINLPHLDANNLYSLAMIQRLPRHGFVWEKVDDFTFEKIGKLVNKDKKGYILEVDEEHPKELHKNYSKLPFLAERIKIGVGKASTKS